MFYKKITKQELDLMERPDGITPNFTFENYVINRNEETGEVIEEYYTNLTIHMTADEAYQKDLEDKGKPSEPSKMEVLNEQVVALEKENKLLKAQVEVLSQTADFHEELIAEMAMQVYA